ncbi:MAG: DUF2603 domain-containing protein [Sulfurospirillaceae bacterium]|nr:DUF2603 domain-containing protein [Sulfurospirillaceae bacterium]
MIENENSKEISVFEKIDQISKELGLLNAREQTILEMQHTDNPDVKTLSLKSGSWSGAEPWFIIDDDQKLHTVISIDSLTKMIENFRKMQQETFNLKLEKTILQHVPIDFLDVWTVAMEEIRSIASAQPEAKAINIDLEKLVGKIKQEHPNLFLNLKDFYLPNYVDLAQSDENDDDDEEEI